MDTAAARANEKLFFCQKSSKVVPLAGPRCLNPKAFCKWRTACPIQILEKEEARERARR